MVLELAFNLFFSAVDLLKMAFIVSVPAFCGVLLGKELKKAIEKKIKGSWLKSAFIVTYIFSFVIVFLLYVFPLISASSELSQRFVPEELNPTLTDSIIAVGWALIKILFAAFVIAIFLVLLEFVGLYVFEWLEKKYKLNYFAGLFVGVFAASLVALIIVLFLFPWTLTGLIYLIYFA